MNKVIELCRQIVTCLEKGNYDSLREHNALNRVSEEDIKRVVKEYGGCISPIPDEAFNTNAFQVYKYNDGSGLRIDLDLWIDGERSDLTLQIEVKMDCNNNIVGKSIIEEQGGSEKAQYGAGLLKELSKQMTHDFGKGFTVANLKNMRQFYLTFPNGYALRSELSWTHYRLLMRVENENARDFYMQEAVKSQWSMGRGFVKISFHPPSTDSLRICQTGEGISFYPLCTA